MGKYVDSRRDSRQKEEENRFGNGFELAVKCMKGNLKGQRRYCERLRQEVNIMSSMSHPNIIAFVGN